MENDKYLMPFGLGSELSAESFNFSQCDNTYRLAGSRYFQFYSGYIRPRIAMYNGWIQGFHNMEYGVIPSLFLQKIGNGIVNTLFSKPIVLNSQNEKTNSHVLSKVFKKAKLFQGIKEVYSFAVSGGTGLIKLNCDESNTLRVETVPMNKFFIEVDTYGDVERVKSYVATYHDTINADVEYYLCEERFFRYAIIGSEKKRFPMVHYTFYKTSSNITYEQTPSPSETLTWKDIPFDVRATIERDYGSIRFDSYDGFNLDKRFSNSRSDGERSTVYANCRLLPFDDDLGCRLIKFTNTISSFPKLPFGQPLADLLMNESYEFDQLKFFERVEVYLAKGRVMVDEGQVNPNDPDSRKKALDPMVFTFYDNTMGDTKDGKPSPIQMALRADDIRTQKQNILNDTAFSLNLSSSTVAAWLSDGTTQRTATEIECEKTKTDSFINDKIEIIREPLQELVDIYFHFYGLTSPELNIMPESQTSRSDNIRLYSELYDKGHVTAKILAEKILGTCSAKEVGALADYIDMTKAQQSVMPGQVMSDNPI